MIALDFGAPFRIDAAHNRIADSQRAAFDFRFVSPNVGADFLRVGDFRARVFGFDDSAVSDLSARFGVKGRAVENQKRLLARARLFARLVADKKRGDFRFALGRIVADELGRRAFENDDFLPDIKFRRRARALALRLHAFVKRGFVDLEPAFARDVGGQIERESVSVVEFERKLSFHFRKRRIGIERRIRFHESVQTLRLVFGEALFQHLHFERFQICADFGKRVSGARPFDRAGMLGDKFAADDRQSLAVCVIRNRPPRRYALQLLFIVHVLTDTLFSVSQRIVVLAEPKLRDSHRPHIDGCCELGHQNIAKITLCMAKITLCMAKITL